MKHEFNCIGYVCTCKGKDAKEKEANNTAWNEGGNILHEQGSETQGVEAESEGAPRSPDADEKGERS